MLVRLDYNEFSWERFLNGDKYKRKVWFSIFSTDYCFNSYPECMIIRSLKIFFYYNYLFFMVL